jgi:membrane protease YdiL (CAAX protease family)
LIEQETNFKNEGCFEKPGIQTEVPKEIGMNTITSSVKRHPLIAYFVLAFALAWMLIPLVVSVSVAFGLLALFAPTIAAISVTSVIEGRSGVKQLLRRVVQWQVALKWFIVAVGLPLILSSTVLVLNQILLGEPVAILQNEAPVLTVILGLLVVGEEIGWRGFALPRLQRRYNSLTASLILGTLWAAWHLPNALIPGLERYLTAFPVFLVWVVSMTVLFTWLANHTRGSVLIAWLFHAAINVSLGFLFIGDNVSQWWLSAGVFAVTALIIVIITGSGLARRTAVLQNLGLSSSHFCRSNNDLFVERSTITTQASCRMGKLMNYPTSLLLDFSCCELGSGSRRRSGERSYTPAPTCKPAEIALAGTSHPQRKDILL